MYKSEEREETLRQKRKLTTTCAGNVQVQVQLLRLKHKFHYIYLVGDLSATRSPISLEQKFVRDIQRFSDVSDLSATCSQTFYTAFSRLIGDLVGNTFKAGLGIRDKYSGQVLSTFTAHHAKHNEDRHIHFAKITHCCRTYFEH